jgi:hypothetical protein
VCVCVCMYVRPQLVSKQWAHCMNRLQLGRGYLALLYITLIFRLLDTPLACNIVHILTALLLFAFVVTKFPNL